jgi:thioredoxin-like negative regulator of GroEL
VYTNAAVAEALPQKFVPVRLSFDLQQDLVRHYHVEAIPYLLFTNSYGTELLHHRGILDAKNLTALIEALPEDVSDFNRLDRVLQKDNRDLDALVDMAARLAKAGLYQASNEFYGRALKRDEAKKKTDRRQGILMGMAQNFLELQDEKHASKMLNSVISEFPKSDAARKARQLLSR